MRAFDQSPNNNRFEKTQAIHNAVVGTGRNKPLEKSATAN
jgi:hypothetical protein